MATEAYKGKRVLAVQKRIDAAQVEIDTARNVIDKAEARIKVEQASLAWLQGMPVEG